MKHEWRKKEKEIYLPKEKPVIVTLPSFKYFMIEGRGNPNNDAFANYIEVLYSLSYAVRMSHKAGFAPDNYIEYTVYPLEGVWDISDEAKQRNSSKLDKDSLLFNLMIRQPDFVTEEFAQEAMERSVKKKPHDLLKQVTFQSVEEGMCLQMLHLGSYDDEPESFRMMEAYCSAGNLIRTSRKHREIYLSDPRKISPEKLKTVLRFKIRSLDE